jgi:type I restriction enzyme S subunit
MKQIVSNVLESRSLAATRDLLLPKLMSGEIRLKDAKKRIEETL